MATILDDIIAAKRIEVAERKVSVPFAQLERSPLFARQCLSMRASLLQSSTGIIAEFKRKSPSKGWINQNANIQQVAGDYCQYGAAGISILTDTAFFGGTLADLATVRPRITCPILRKDFVIDEYQLVEAKSIGADLVLLIAAAMSAKVCRNLAHLAQQLGMDTLLEVHNTEELEHLNEYVDIAGVNNRNLKTFEVATDTSLSLASKIPAAMVKISESGISNTPTINTLRAAGYNGFLMGESFMKEQNPGEAFRGFCQSF
ncbi:indole-3-glycerol phosphate synthase [Bacteroidia bacterium]|nr:indole-3-glycerol phosphate synthase [Bacteroidia bacterium]